MTASITFNELVWLHENSYGKTIRIPKTHLKAAVTVLCFVTPATNWLQPFALPKIGDIKLN